MKSKNLPPLGKSLDVGIEDHLKATGLGVELIREFKYVPDPFHTHEFVEMLFMLRGTCEHYTGDYTFKEKAGNMAIINYNQFHCYRMTDDPFDFMNIYWNPEKYHAPELPEPLSSRLHDLIPAHPKLGHRLNRIVRLQLDDPEETHRLLFRLYKEQNEEAPGSEAAIDALFRLLLIEVCRSASIVPESHEEEFNPRMEKIRRYLEKHYVEPIRIEQLCTLSGLKEANLCRQFKKYTGLSIGGYLKQRRLSAAMLQLRTTGDKVLTICYDCGFSDITYFNRTFRKAIGKTPSDYRKLFTAS
ncbi:MAG: hypothetical protein DRP64_04060 [Verrucomicrobia bacterium]|nr:MAG: hypothetical protein DRP64_04060 [Verrucomicrobiota bacterium]